MTKFVLLLVMMISFSFSAFAHEPPPSDPNSPAALGPRKSRKELKKEMREEMREKREMVHAKVMEACGADMQTAGCSGKTGGDMMQCMRTYREANPNFKMSEACREAHSEKRELKREMHEMKKDMRHQKSHHGMGGSQAPVSGTAPAGP